MLLIKSNIVSLHGAAISMQGGRPENQDDMTFLDTPLGFLAVICDGMGGGPGGKTASYIAKYEIANTLCECTPQTPRDHALKMAASRANDALEKKMNDVPSLQGMGSTFVAVLISKDSAFVAHAGDSRCYLLRGKRCVFRTKDHSLVGELVRKKALTEEEARISPQSNVISRGLGSTTNHVPEIEELPYKKGDRIVLCTDGVWGAMPQSELLKRFTQKSSSQQVVSNISSEVNNIGFSKGGGHDNHTIAIFDLSSSSVLKPKTNMKRIAIMCSVLFVMIVTIAVMLVFIFKKDDKSLVLSTSSEGASSHTTYDRGDSPNLFLSDLPKDTNNIEDSVKSKTGQEEGEFMDTDSIKEKLKSKLRQKRDSVNNQKKKKKNPTSVESKKNDVNKPAEITQKVINRYNSAKSVEGQTAEDAQNKLEDLRKEVKALMSELQKQCSDNIETLAKVEAIGRLVDDKRSWFVNKEKDKTTGKFKPTQNAQNLMDKQIKRLTELKRKL